MNWNNLKIGSRLYILIGVMALMLIGIGSFGLYGIKVANNEMQALYNNNLLTTHMIDEINFLMTRNRLVISNTVIDPSPEKISKYSAEVEANIASISKNWQEVTAKPMSPEMAKAAKGYAETRKVFVEQALRPAVAAMRANDIKEAKRLVVEKIHVLYDAATPYRVGLIEANLADGKLAYENSAAQYLLSRNLTLGTLFVGLLFGAIFGMVLVRGITRPLSRAVEVADEVAAGRLDGVIDVQGRDETAQLLTSMAKMQSVLGEFQAKTLQGKGIFVEVSVARERRRERSATQAPSTTIFARDLTARKQAETQRLALETQLRAISASLNSGCSLPSICISRLSMASDGLAMGSRRPRHRMISPPSFSPKSSPLTL